MLTVKDTTICPTNRNFINAQWESSSICAYIICIDKSLVDTCEFYLRYHLKIWTEKGNQYKSNEAAEIKEAFCI